MKDVTRVGPFLIPSDSEAIKILRGWQEKGYKLVDMIERAIIAYGKKEEK